MKVNYDVINEKYMNWLEYFILEHPSFHDDEYLFINNNINDKDRKNVLNINILYRLIEKYEKQHNRKVKNDDIWDYYIIKYNNSFYKIIFELDSVLITKISNCNQDYIEFNKIEECQKNNDNFDKTNYSILQKRKGKK